MTCSRINKYLIFIFFLNNFHFYFFNLLFLFLRRYWEISKILIFYVTFQVALTLLIKEIFYREMSHKNGNIILTFYYILKKIILKELKIF